MNSKFIIQGYIFKKINIANNNSSFDNSVKIIDQNTGLKIDINTNFLSLLGTAVLNAITDGTDSSFNIENHYDFSNSKELRYFFTIIPGLKNYFKLRNIKKENIKEYKLILRHNISVTNIGNKIYFMITTLYGFVKNIQDEFKFKTLPNKYIMYFDTDFEKAFKFVEFATSNNCSIKPHGL